MLKLWFVYYFILQFEFLYVSVFYYIDFKNLMGIDDILKIEYYE